MIFQSKRSDASVTGNLRHNSLFDHVLQESVCFPLHPVRGVNLSESEAEQDGEHNITELPQVYSGRGNMRAQQSAVRLTEVSERSISATRFISSFLYCIFRVVYFDCVKSF